MRVVYRNTDNSVGVLIPASEALEFATIEQIAEKDVPFELAYKIVDDSEIPADRSQREMWEWDSNIEPDGFGGESNEFDEELLAVYNMRIKK